MTNLRESRRLLLTENALIEWSPSALLRAVTFGVRVGERDLARLFVYRRLGSMIAAWFRWQTALPGDRFWDIQRDLMVEVHHGTPKRRTVRLMTPEALSYPSVQRVGLDGLMSLVIPQPNYHQWWELYPWNQKRSSEGKRQ